MNKRILVGVLVVGAFVVTRGAGAAGPAPAARKVIEVDGCTITNIGPWTDTTRMQNRPDDLWRYYMHGWVDHFATPIAWKDLFGPGQDMAKWLDRDETIDTAYKKSNLPAVKMDPPGNVRTTIKLRFGNPLPIDLVTARGRKLRLFMWMKDVAKENMTGRRMYPNVYLTFVAAGGKVLRDEEAPCLFRTRAPFPWHCYYGEWFVPSDTQAVYLTLSAWRCAGTVCFSTPSWEIATPENTPRYNDKQDPMTGSSSPNPVYDDLACLLGDVGGRHPWNFLRGGTAGMVAMPYDLTTKEGFRKYYFEMARDPEVGEPDDMHRGVRELPKRLRLGMRYKTLPPLEEGWFENFTAILVGGQDPKTGFWPTFEGKPSLAVTFHLAHENFSYYGIARPDRPDVISEEALLKGLPKAQTIVRTVLDTQSSYTDAKGVKRKAAWCNAAYDYAPAPDAYPDKCDLGSTWDAIYLLRIGAREVDDKTKAEVYDSVKAAFHYALERLVLPDGSWKSWDAHKTPTNYSYMQSLVRDTSYIERRIYPERPAPKVSVAARPDHSWMFTWSRPVKDQNSVRIYVAPDSVPPENVNERYLKGIIHRTGQLVHEMDPFIAFDTFRKVLTERCGAPYKVPGETEYGGQNYEYWKLRMLTFPLARTDDLAPLTLRIEDAAKKKAYVSAADWYGEESAPVPIALPAQ